MIDEAKILKDDANLTSKPRQFFSLNLGGIPIEEFNKPSARSQSEIH